MNRFDKYVGTDYVPIPFQELMAAGERQQKSYDVADTLKAEAIGFLDDMRVVKGDEPVWNAYREKAKSEMDQIVKDYESHKDNSKLLRDTKIWANRAARNPIVALNQERVKKFDERYNEYSKNPGAYVKSPYEQSLKPGVVMDEQSGRYTTNQDYNIQNEPWLDYLGARDAAVKPINDAVYDMGINPRQLNFGKDGTVTVMEEGSSNRVDFRKTKALQEKVNQAMNTFDSLPAGQQYMKYATPGNQFGFSTPEEFIKAAFTPKTNMQRQVIQNSFKDGAGKNDQDPPAVLQVVDDIIDPMSVESSKLASNTLFGQEFSFTEDGKIKPTMKELNGDNPLAFARTQMFVTSGNKTTKEFDTAVAEYKSKYPAMKDWSPKEVYNGVMEMERQKIQLSGKRITLPAVEQTKLLNDVMNSGSKVIAYKVDSKGRREPLTDITNVGQLKGKTGDFLAKDVENINFVPYRENPVPGKAPITGALTGQILDKNGDRYEFYVEGSENSKAVSREVAEYGEALRLGPGNYKITASGNLRPAQRGEESDIVVDLQSDWGNTANIEVYKKQYIDPRQAEAYKQAYPESVGTDSRGTYIKKSSSEATMEAGNMYYQRFLPSYVPESRR